MPGFAILRGCKDMAEPRIQGAGPVLWEKNQNLRSNYSYFLVEFSIWESKPQSRRTRGQGTNASFLWFFPKAPPLFRRLPFLPIHKKGPDCSSLKPWVLMSNTLRQYVVGIFSMQYHLIRWLWIILWTRSGGTGLSPQLLGAWSRKITTSWSDWAT